MIKNKMIIGDVVKLKSGSPLMVVEKIDTENNAIQCIWFIENYPQRAPFLMGTLKKTSR